MTKIAIVSDTSCDMSEELAKKNRIHLANAYVHFGTDTYDVTSLGLDKFHDMIERTSKQTFPRTSQPSAHDLLEIYERLKDEGYDTILSIHVSAKLSGTINSANVAVGLIDDIDIRIIDSKGVSANLLATLLYARELVDQKLTLDDITTKIDTFTDSLTAYITFKTLDNLMKGGRIGRIQGRIGKLLNIKPIIQLNNGELATSERVRGLDKARERVFELSTAVWEKYSKFKYVIAHTRETALAAKYEDKVKEHFPKAQGVIIEVGIVVATHGGKGALLILTYD